MNEQLLDLLGLSWWIAYVFVAVFAAAIAWRLGNMLVDRIVEVFRQK